MVDSISETVVLPGGEKKVIKRAILTLVSTLGLLTLFALQADSQSKVPIIVQESSKTLYRAAILRFATLPDASPDMADVLYDGVMKSLDFSDAFLKIDPRAFLDDPVSPVLEETEQISCMSWRQIGADALVLGTIGTVDEQLRVEFQVVDVQRSCRRVLRKRYTGGESELRRIGLAIGDDVVEAFTGKPGVADTEIAFASTLSGKKEIFVMDALGGNLRAVTRNGSINSFPSWSPQGESIVYTSYRYLNRPSVFLLTREGRSPGRILRNLPGHSAVYRAIFHPLEPIFAFTLNMAGTSEIGVSRRNGDGFRRLTNNGVIDISPSWSPDGKKIAFVSDRSGSPQVYIMDRDGRNQRRVTYMGNYNTHPAWSPDSRWIVYESRVRSQFDLWLIDPTGSVNYPLVDHPASDEYPSWSPDGRKILFSSSRGGKADIFVVGVDGKNLIRLTHGKGEKTNPAWGPYRR